MSTKTPREQLINHLMPVYQSHLGGAAAITVQGIVDFSMPVLDALLEEARKEEREKNEKIQNAYGVYVADTMDGVEPEEAYKHMTKTIDSISSL